MSDDISFCFDAYDIPCDGSECERYDCERHPCNIVDRLIPHSYMNFYGTEFCKKGKRMNFSDKIKGEEFMNLPEVEDDIEEEKDDEEFSLAELFGQKEYTDEELKDNTDRIVKHTVYHFMQLDKALFNEGFADKDERYRIIEIIWR